MRKAAIVAAAAFVASLVPATASAWGFTAHKYIMGRALDLLPPDLKPFFDRHREEVVVRAIDPDVWRNVGWEDNPNHFMDFGMKELGRYPFAELPREYGAAIDKFGQPMLARIGTLPWREAEEFGSLRRAFEGFEHDSSYDRATSCWSPAWRPTTCRTPISRFTPRTTSTGSSPTIPACTRASSATSSSASCGG
jgi:hypothetical protein